MSQDDLKTYGTSLGMGEILDNPQSLKFNCQPNQSGSGPAAYPTVSTTYTGGLVGGNGLVNNAPFSNSGALAFIIGAPFTCTSASTTLTLAGGVSALPTQIIPGLIVQGTGIAAGTVVSSVTSTTVVLSIATLAAVSTAQEFLFFSYSSRLT